jgi:beta-fructofuranosidase
MLTGNLLVLNKVGREPDAPENEKGDRLYLFSSDNLVDWQYVHRFYESDRKWTEASEDNMCPSFLPLPSSAAGGPPSNKHLLLFISHNLGCQYYIGSYNNDKFIPENHGRMTWVDNAYFAPEALIDGQGRQIMWSWIFDDRPDKVKAEYGWTGTYGLPRSLWLGGDGKLRMRPVRELQNLRLNEKIVREFEVAPGNDMVLDSIGASLMELEVTVSLRNAEQIKMEVCVSEDGRERTSIIYDNAGKKLIIDTNHSSLGYGRKTMESAPFELRKGEPLVLRIFIDKSIVEVYANDRQAIARRIYPTLDGNGIRLSANGGDLKVLSLKRWEMTPSNPY